MRIHTISALLGALLLTPSLVLAQLGPTLTVTSELWPNTSLSDAAIDGTDATLGSATMSTVSTGLAATYPVIWGRGRTIIVPGLAFRQLRFDHDGWPRATPVAVAAYHIDVSLSLQHRLSSRWSLTAELTSSVASDFGGPIASGDFVLQGAALAVWQATPRFATGFGAAYSTVLGTPVPLPLVLLLATGDTWRAEALLPTSVEVWWASSPRIEVGISAEALGSRHRLGAEAGLFEHPYAEALTLTVGPSVNVRVAPWLHLGFDSGISLYRQVRVTDGGDELSRYEPDQAAFIRTRLTLGG